MFHFLGDAICSQRYVQWSEQGTCGIRILAESTGALLWPLAPRFFHRNDLEIDCILGPTCLTRSRVARIHFLRVEKLMLESGYQLFEDNMLPIS